MSANIKSSGPSQHCQPSMTSMQAEMAEAPFERPRGEHPLVSLALWVGVIAVAALLWRIFA